MPLLSRWMIRLAFFDLWVGFTIAALLLSRKGLPERISGEFWQWMPAHYDLLLVGWMVQLSLGVAYWILPRIARHERGRPRMAGGGAIALNVGVMIFAGAVMISPWVDWSDGLLSLQVIGLALQLLGMLSFAGHLLPRIRSIAS
jgi:hypothetical protein